MYFRLKRNLRVVLQCGLGNSNNSGHVGGDLVDVDVIFRHADDIAFGDRRFSFFLFFFVRQGARVEVVDGFGTWAYSDEREVGGV